ncbi:Dyp-type peroxidase [Gordonia phthalatica]|uniref:Peroxidase n=1 Tax=Gordonia phthalatica TaxID=1136941 RepID=A0A0N9N424_9ACTN|nr:Dyp-type peroxidase [Gordonia phthalatica]ALG85555.1 peroxidase [Gordonia phthalatica]
MRDINRRSLLKGGLLGAAGAAATIGVVGQGVAADRRAAEPASIPTLDSYPVHGARQSGVDAPPAGRQQAASEFMAVRVTATDRAGLETLFTQLTVMIRRLAGGLASPDTPVARPPADNGVLGAGPGIDGLTITVAVGASLFDDRFGLADKRPAGLTPMRVFGNDRPEPAWTGGDLLIQVCANHADATHRAVRELLRATRENMQVLWRIRGFGSPPRPEGTPRNLLGFKDGTANPQGDDARSLIWVEDDRDQPWTVGGTYVVVRLIRMFTEFWDRISINEQERIFGRRRDSGAPLDGNAEFDVPDYRADPHGFAVPTDAHIRLANPRTDATAGQRLIRRSYNYDLGVDANGNLQAGHIFVCFQKSIQEQFETVQERLDGEPLEDYVQPFGGGYFFVLPGIRDSHDVLGSGLLARSSKH